VASAASSSAWRACRHSFVTGMNIARWSAHSCSAPRTIPGRRSVVGTSVAMTTTGERDAHASPVAPNVLAAPGPVVTRATPTLPLARA
jgi:hypothetical protein